MLPCLAVHEHEQTTETNCILTVYTGKDKTRDDVSNVRNRDDVRVFIFLVLPLWLLQEPFISERLSLHKHEGQINLAFAYFTP